jgi:hypothetical protein
MHIINEAIIDRLVTSLAEIIARQIITDYAISRRHEMKMKEVARRLPVEVKMNPPKTT